MAVSGFSPRSLGGIMLPKGPRTYKVKFKLWGYVEVDAENAEDAEYMVSDLAIPELIKQGTITNSDLDEPEEVW